MAILLVLSVVMAQTVNGSPNTLDDHCGTSDYKRPERRPNVGRQTLKSMKKSKAVSEATQVGRSVARCCPFLWAFISG